MATTDIPAPASRWRLPASVSVLAERDFRVVWTGQAVSMVGTWMQVVAQGLLVLQLWDSPMALGVVNFANALPSLMVMLFGGVLADRADKRKILLATQVLLMASAVLIGALIVADVLEFWMILVVTMLVGVAFGYDMPAYQAFLPELVPQEKISQVVALNSATFHGSRMIGPALAGVVVSAFGVATAYFLNAASFIAVIFGLMIVAYRPAVRAAAHIGSTLDGLKDGLRHARARPGLQLMLLMTVLNCAFLFPAMAILSPYYVTDVLGRGAGLLGVMWAVSGVGSLLGAMALIWWPTQWRTERLWAASLAGPLALAVMALTREPVVAIAAAGVVSVAFSSQGGLFQAMIQETTPHEYRGRVMSLHGIAFNGTMPVAGLASAGLAVAIGLPGVMVAAAAVYLVLACWVMRFWYGGVGRVVEEAGEQFRALAIGGRPRA
jgi:MFS family permease